MVSEQNADGFPAHARHQLPLHGFLSDEPHTPACLPRWWLATDHGDDTLALARVQPPLLARARLLVQRRLQPNHCPPQHPRRLPPSVQHPGYLLLLLLLQLDMHPMIGLNAPTIGPVA